MRRQSVKKYFNKRILEELQEGRSYDEVRQDLITKSRNFREKVYNLIDDQNFIINEDKVGTVTGKAKALSFYVLEAEKRVIDLYQIERDFDFGFDPEKNFKLLIFKERITDPDVEDILPF